MPCHARLLTQERSSEEWGNPELLGCQPCMERQLGIPVLQSLEKEVLQHIPMALSCSTMGPVGPGEVGSGQVTR